MSGYTFSHTYSGGRCLYFAGPINESIVTLSDWTGLDDDLESITVEDDIATIIYNNGNCARFNLDTGSNTAERID